MLALHFAFDPERQGALELPGLRLAPNARTARGPGHVIGKGDEVNTAPRRNQAALDGRVDGLVLRAARTEGRQRVDART
jgi:hypothetical protein